MGLASSKQGDSHDDVPLIADRTVPLSADIYSVRQRDRGGEIPARRSFLGTAGGAAFENV